MTTSILPSVPWNILASRFTTLERSASYEYQEGETARQISTLSDGPTFRLMFGFAGFGSCSSAALTWPVNLQAPIKCCYR